jgi:predicted Zn-dependent peptidase
LVADMVTNSNYDPRAIKRELGTIHSEVLNCRNDFWNTLAETSHFASFRNDVLGLPILGLVDNLEKIDRQKIVNYHRDNYHGDNIVVVTAGGLDHREIVEMCEKAFENIKPTPASKK